LILDTGFSILDTGYRILDAGCPREIEELRDI